MKTVRNVLVLSAPLLVASVLFTTKAFGLSGEASTYFDHQSVLLDRPYGITWGDFQPAVRACDNANMCFWSHDMQGTPALRISQLDTATFTAQSPESNNDVFTFNNNPGPVAKGRFLAAFQEQGKTVAGFSRGYLYLKPQTPPAADCNTKENLGLVAIGEKGVYICQGAAGWKLFSFAASPFPFPFR